jgi:hypothetical protein
MTGGMLAAPLARDAKSAVGVVVERRKGATPWQDHMWLPVGVVVGSALREPWSMMHEGPDATQFFAGEHEIELNPRETGNYQVNLAAEQPAVYVVLRFEDGAAPLGVRIQLVTVSPAEAQGYLEGGADVVEPVPMPEPVAVWLSAYVAAYHVEEPFRKRQRQKLDPRKVGFGRRDGGRA